MCQRQRPLAAGAWPRPCPPPPTLHRRWPPRAQPNGWRHALPLSARDRASCRISTNFIVRSSATTRSMPRCGISRRALRMRKRFPEGAACAATACCPVVEPARRRNGAERVSTKLSADDMRTGQGEDARERGRVWRSSEIAVRASFGGRHATAFFSLEKNRRFDPVRRRARRRQPRPRRVAVAETRNDSVETSRRAVAFIELSGRKEIAALGALPSGDLALSKPARNR